MLQRCISRLFSALQQNFAKELKINLLARLFKEILYF